MHRHKVVFYAYAGQTYLEHKTKYSIQVKNDFTNHCIHYAYPETEYIHSVVLGVL